jgi:hypothetical protein
MKAKTHFGVCIPAMLAALFAMLFMTACSTSSDDDFVEPPVAQQDETVSDFQQAVKYESTNQFKDDLDAFNRYAFAVRALRWNYWMLTSDSLKSPDDFFTVAPENLGKNAPEAFEQYLDILEKVCDSLDIYEAAMANLEDNGILATNSTTKGIISDALGFGIACKSSAAMGRQAVMGVLRSGGWSTDVHMLTELYNSLPDNQRRGYSDAITFWKDFSAGKLDNRSNLIFKSLYDMPGSLDAADFRDKCKEIGISPSTNMAVIGEKLAEAGANLIIDGCPINLGQGVDIFNTVEAQYQVMTNSFKFNKDGTYEGINTDVWKNYAKVWGHNVANYGRDFQKFMDKVQVDFQSEFFMNWDEGKDWWIDNVFKDVYDFTANEVLFSDNLREACNDHGKSLGLQTKAVIRTVNDRPYSFVYIVDPATGKIRLGFVRDDYGNIVIYPGPEPVTKTVTVVNRQTGKRATKTVVVQEGSDTDVEVDLEFDEEKLEENPENGELTLRPSTSYEDQTGAGGSVRFTIVTNYLYYNCTPEGDWLSASIPSDANFMYVKMTKNDTGKVRTGKVLLHATDSKGKVLKTVTLNVTQQPYIEEGGSVKASPSTLEFDANGGKLQSTITYSSGAVYTGIDYDDELSGWLSISSTDVYGGSFTLVAEANPNDTGKERSGTVTVYAAYNQEALDNAMNGNVDPKLVLSTTILVKQKTDAFEWRIDPNSIMFGAELYWLYNNGDVDRYFTDLDRLNTIWAVNIDNCELKMAKKGEGFSVSASLTLRDTSTKNYPYDYEEYKTSFDISKTEDTKYGPVNNFVYEYYGSNKSGDYLKWTLKATEVPCTETDFHKGGWGHGSWRASEEKKNLKITSLEGERYAATADTPTKRTFTLSPNEKNTIHIYLGFY